MQTLISMENVYLFACKEISIVSPLTSKTNIENYIIR
jgi:hypothetical protein